MVKQSQLAQSEALVKLRQRIIASGATVVQRDGSQINFEAHKLSSDLHLGRFLKSRKWNVEKAEKLLAGHLRFRKETFPVVRTPGIELVQTSARCIDEVQRLRFLGYNEVGRPIIVMNWFYGEFWDDGAKPNDVLKAFADFAQEVLDRAEQERGPKGLEIIGVCSGGPPPGFVKRLLRMMEENFPEVLFKAAVYPVPWYVQYIANSLMSLLPYKSAQKVKLLSTEGQLADLLGLAVEHLPPDLRGGVQAVEKRIRPDTHTKVWKCVKELMATEDRASENEELWTCEQL